MAIKAETKQYSFYDLFTSLKLGESYVSLILGIVVVIGAVILLFSWLNHASSSKQIIALNTINKQRMVRQQLQQPIAPMVKTYTTVAGDDLWHIAQKFYNSGYNWVDIAKANSLTNPDVIYAGTKLIIPQVTPILLAQTAIVARPVATTNSGDNNPNAITGNTYVVKSGDILWDIALRAYADGYSWVKIARANHLTNPNLIYSGNVLTIPR